MILLTIFDVSIYRDTAMAQGASAYVVKKLMLKELLPAIQRVMRTGHPIEPGGQP